MESFEAEGKILKIDDDEHNVFGIFNMSTLKGKLVLDGQDEVIPTNELEKAAYNFVLHSRLAGKEHIKIGVGTLIESFVMTNEKAEALESVLKEAGADAVISPDAEFWFGGFHIEDDELWKEIKSGEFKSFSIGGVTSREEIVEVENG